MASDNQLYSKVFSNALQTQLPSRPVNNLYTTATLIEKRRETEEVDEALRSMKEDFHAKMDGFQQRREELQKKEYEMKQSFLKFDRFIRDSEMKRFRALTKQAEEREVTSQLAKEIEELKKLRDQLAEERELVAKKEEKYSHFERFIEKAVEYSTDFREPKELMARFEALLSIQSTLAVQDRSGQAEILKERQEWQDYSEMKSREILHHTQELAALRNHLEKTRQISRRHEAVLDKIQEECSETLIELGQISMVAFNLYKTAQKVQEANQKSMPQRMSDDVFGLLDDVDETIKELLFTTSEVKRLVVDERNTQIAAEEQERLRLARQNSSKRTPLQSARR